MEEREESLKTTESPGGEKATKKELKAQAKEAKRAQKQEAKAAEGKQDKPKAQKQKKIGERKAKNWKNKKGSNLYVDEMELRACDMDLANRWRPSSIFVSTQQYGERHSIYLGCSHQDLADKGAFFILLRQRVDVLQYPGSADVLRGETWAGEIHRTIFPRFYRFYDEEDQLCVSCSTLWALCSAEDRKIIHPKDVGISLPPPPFEDLAEPGKLRFGEEPDYVRVYRARYSDFDFNGHVNNTRYVDWCCDMFSVERFRERSFRNLQINYVHEMREESEVRIELRDLGETFAIRGSMEEDGQVIFQAAGSWMDAPPNEMWRIVPEDDE